MNINMVTAGYDSTVNKYYTLLLISFGSKALYAEVTCDGIKNDDEVQNYQVQFKNEHDLSPILYPYSYKLFDDIEQTACEIFWEMVTGVVTVGE